jgi:4,5-DOPA dioxygenase extradiol
MKQALPSFYLSHGSPLDALVFGESEQQRLDELAKYPQPKAILIMSPHWFTGGIKLTSSLQPETIHDFYGFPDELFAIQYPAKGDLELAIYAQSLLTFAGYEVELDAQRGLDHGVWAPLRHLYPEADIPVVALSMPRTSTPESLYKMGYALRSLRQEGVLVIGSGSTTHNLRDVRQPGQPEYVTVFTDWLKTRLEKRELATLLNYRSVAPYAQAAHPTDEHLIPLYFALGAAGDEWINLKHMNNEVRHSAIAMDSWMFGINAE